jgi:phage FluMu protein gp41
MAETTYYLRVNGKVMGPLSIEKLQSLQERGLVPMGASQQTVKALLLV